MGTQLTTHTSLIDDLASGKDASWRAFADRYGELIRWFARRRGLQWADCEDVLQEVLLALSKAMPGFSYDRGRGKFRSYLKTVAERIIRQRFLQVGASLPLCTIDEATGADAAASAIEDLWEAEWRRYHLRLAMSTVEHEFQAGYIVAFTRHWLQGEPAVRVAGDLGMSVALVYKATSLVKERVREHLSRQVEAEG